MYEAALPAANNKSVLLVYGEGGENWAHQDDNRDFSFQALLMLSQPEVDFRGGALYVTIFNLLLVKYIKAAVPLSKSTILGAAIGNFVALARQSHPHADRPKIDYEISTFMQSGELLGVTFGVLLNMLKHF